jgi:hypothetical protein
LKNKKENLRMLQAENQGSAANEKFRECLTIQSARHSSGVRLKGKKLAGWQVSQQGM